MADASLLVNGGFETGDLTGWTVEGTVNVVGVGANATLPAAGSYLAEFSVAAISQDIGAVVPGDTITVSAKVAVYVGRNVTLTVSFDNGESESLASGSTVDSTKWESRSLVVVVPAGASFATLKVSGDTIYTRVDEVAATLISAGGVRSW